MANKPEVFALYEKMRFELEKCFHQRSHTFLRKPENLFNLVLRTTKRTRYLNDIDIRNIRGIASKLYGSNDDYLQNATFEFMRNLINIFARARIRHNRGHILTELLTIYPDIAFQSQSRSEMFSKASRHAAKLCSIKSPYRVYALRAFDLDHLAVFPLSRFKRDAILNLLCIVSQKIDSDPGIDHSLPAVVNFLRDVGEKLDDCDCVIKVCSFLSQLLEIIAKNNLARSFAIIRSSNIFEWALSHVTFSTQGRSCWEAVAHLLKNAFKFGDASTKLFLADIGAFQKVLEMFKDRRPEVIAQLLDFITEVCAGPDLLYINQALNSNVIHLVVPFVKYEPHPKSIQQRATRALDAFFTNADIEQMFRGLNEGMLSAIVMLLMSRNDRAVANALEWLFIVMEKLEAAADPELLPHVRKLFWQAQGNKAMLSLIVHKKSKNSRSALAFFERFAEDPASEKRNSTKLGEKPSITGNQVLRPSLPESSMAETPRTE